MSKSGKNTATSKEQNFPYPMFPIKLIHKDGKDLKDTKICYFQSQSHADKYIARCKFTKKDYQIYVDPKANLEIVGKGTGRKSTQKRSRSRQSSSN
jgi:hypothetical protein